MNRGAVILCGGSSQRLGRDKASAPFGPEQSLLGRVVRQAGEAIGRAPVVCVAAAEQQLPSLPEGTRVVRDRTPGRGPLEALATGLVAVGDSTDAVVALGCDAPLVRPALLELLFSNLAEGADVVAPVVDAMRQPLMAIYRQDLHAEADRVIETGKASLMALLDCSRVKEIPEASLRAADPDLQSFLNCNDESSYQEALHRAGIRE